MQGSERAKREERLLAEIAEGTPGWGVRSPVSIWEAVPAGTPVVTAMTLDDLRDKLARRDQAAADG